VANPFAHEQFDVCAEAEPERIALKLEGGEELNYGDLLRRVRCFASYMQSLSAHVGTLIVSWMDRSPDQLVAMLGTLEAGATHVPLDPASPLTRVAEMVDALDPPIVITDREPAGRPAWRDRIVVTVEEILGRGDPRAWQRPALSPDHLAYVIHTSGSTGSPKRVAMSHLGLSRLVQWQVKRGGEPSLTTLQFSPVCFDVTFQEVFSTLCTGGTLVLLRDRTRRDPKRLVGALDEMGVERLFLPYVALQQLARVIMEERFAPRDLRHIITAGERLVVTSAIANLFRLLPKARLDNHYGPTEAHLVTSWKLPRDPSDWPELPPIGTAVDGVTTHILDRALRPVADQEPGELYVGGIGVALGYLGAPRLTAERFLPDPCADSPGGRMYATGDVVQRLPGGVLAFLGRSDEQIKVRGFRVEPAEVERAIADHRGVRAVAVGLRELAPGVHALMAYVVGDRPTLDVASLTEHLRARLPDYMIPHRFVPLDSLPLTGTGKVDRHALSTIPLPSTGVDAIAVAGAALVELVMSVWKRVLGHDDFDPRSDFFDVGGDSLLAAWVVSELGQRVGREVALTTFLDDSSPEGIARALTRRGDETGGEHRSELVTLKVGPPHSPLILVHALGGEVLAYRELAHRIRARRRVLGLRWLARDDAGPRLGLPELAATHARTLVTLQPTGSFALAGWSFGGVVAFEIAQQLTRQGREVAFLGLLDANPLRDPVTGLPTEDPRLYDALCEVVATFDQHSDSAAARLALSKKPLVAGLLGNTVDETVGVSHLRKYLEAARRGVWAAMHYRPEAYPGRVDLFQAGSTPPSRQELLLDDLRAAVAGELRCHTVEGDHHTMLREPSVTQLASAVDLALRGGA